MAPLPNLIDSEIADLTDFFNRTGNAAAAWRAYSLGRINNRVIPDEIVAEVDRFAADVSKLAEKAMTAPLGAFKIRFRPADLGKIWRGKGKGNPVGGLQNEWRDYQIYWAIRSLVNNGKAVGAAQKIIADDTSVKSNFDAVVKVWKRLNRDG